MTDILSQCINATADTVYERISADLQHSDELRIATLNAKMDGLHFLLNDLNLLKTLETWLCALISVTSSPDSKKLFILGKKRLCDHIDERYSDIALYELIIKLRNSARDDGRNTICRALNREIYCFRIAGIELDPDNKILLQEKRARIYKIEQSQLTAIDTAATASPPNVAKGENPYKCHYMKFVESIPKLPVVQLILLRQSVAEMLDYGSYASMIQGPTLAGRPEAVAHVLSQITPEYDYSFSDEVRALLSLNGGKAINAWDLSLLEYELCKRYASVQPPILTTKSVIIMLLKLTSELGIDLKVMPNINENIQHFSCTSGDLYVYMLESANHWQVIPIIHRLATYGNDMEVLVSSRPQIILRGPNTPFTVASLESFIMEWGKALRQLLISGGLAGLLSPESEAVDITGHILLEKIWEERNMQRLEIQSKQTNIVQKTPQYLSAEKIRYLRRKRDLLLGLHAKIEMLHCKYDLIIHSNIALIKTLRACKKDEDGLTELLTLQTRLWRDNMGCANQSKFTITAPPVFEAICWREIYDAPALRYAALWGKLLAYDIYQNVIQAGNGKTYANGMLQFAAMSSTDRLVKKLIGRYPNYTAYYDIKVHLLRSYYDRDDDEESEQISDCSNSKLLVTFNNKK
jgi:hypothetical protein